MMVRVIWIENWCNGRRAYYGTQIPHLVICMGAKCRTWDQVATCICDYYELQGTTFSLSLECANDVAPEDMINDPPTGNPVDMFTAGRICKFSELSRWATREQDEEHECIRLLMEPTDIRTMEESKIRHYVISPQVIS